MLMKQLKRTLLTLVALIGLTTGAWADGTTTGGTDIKLTQGTGDKANEWTIDGGMPGVFTWFERFVDADKVIITLFNRDPMDYRAEDTAWEGIRDIAYGREPGPVVSIEDIAVKDPDRSAWESFCGKYEHPEDDDFIIDEICLKDGDLYAEAIDDDGVEFEFRLYPIGGNEFGRKRGMVKITFADGSISYAGATCRKI